MIADEELTRQAPERAGGEGESPRGVEGAVWSIRGDASHEAAVDVVLVDGAAGRPVFLSICDEYVAPEDLDVKGSEARGKVRIREGARAEWSRSEVRVEDVDGALAEVRGVEQGRGAGAGHRQSPVVGAGRRRLHGDGRKGAFTIGSLEAAGGIHGGTPAYDRSRGRREQEHGRSGVSPVGDLEAIPRPQREIEDVSRRRADGRISWSLHVDHQRLHLAERVVERRHAGAGVRDQ